MRLFTLILCTLNVSLIYSMTFMEYSLSHLERGNRIIHATLTEKESGQVWTMEERISSGDLIEGRIDVTSAKLPEMVNIFYSFKSGGYDNGRRLLMSQNDCALYIYTSEWTRKFPGVTNSLTNMILLMGPSFFLRLTNDRWVEGEDTVVRGALMHSVSSVISQKLKVTLYYKGNYGTEIGVSQPSRIVLTGYNPDEEVEESGETLVMDIYLQSITSQDLSKLVQPIPGIGCPSYLQNNIKLPSISVTKIHFLAKDTPSKGPVSLKEVHMDVARNIIRLAETHSGYTTNYIYDYGLGVEYVLSKSGDCTIYGADSSSVGGFSLASILWMDASFKYLGQVAIEHRAGLVANVWESVENDRTIASGKYDKVVTTAYLIPSSNETIFGGYIFARITRNAYNEDKSGNFELVESVHRDYYDFALDEPEAEYENAFKLGDCYSDSTKRLTLTMHLTCDTGEEPNCIKSAEDSTYVLREALIDKIVRSYGISFLRIVDVEFVFMKERIEVDVTFVEAPKLESSLSTDIQSIDIQSIDQLHPETSTNSEYECLKFRSSNYDSPSAVIYCNNGNKCIDTAHPESIKTDSRSGMCTIYNIPLKNLFRLGQEKSLEEIHDHLLNELVHVKLTFTDSSDYDYSYKISDVVANNKRAQEKDRELFQLLYSGSQLVPNGFDIIEVSNIKRFSDCYRACSKSEEIFCETFSFCEDKDTTKCIVSTLNENQISKNITRGDGCMAYAKNHLTDYTEHPNKAYKSPNSVSQRLWVDECASECSSSSDCFSFESCDGICTFGGYYTEESAKFSPGCRIYSPKLSQRYELTGSKIVTEVLHTELDLDLDQCAGLCFGYQDGNGESCQSFNYCPKSAAPASCQLTSYSVSDSKTVTTQSIDCHNFELASKLGSGMTEKEDNPTSERLTVRTSGSGAFGIITLFLFIGLFVGFVGPYTVMKIRSHSMARRQSNDFNWSRQVDAVEEEIQI